MIKIFRNIRKKLAAENKPMKYLRYAIGEILLVVIGILIALQINNWNENRKIRKQEIQIYKELKSDLLQTKSDILQAVADHKEIIKSTQHLIDDIKNKKPNSDTIYNYFAQSSEDFQIFPKTSAFENLKNIGLNTLANDSLRMDITNLFQLNLERLEDEMGLKKSELSISNILFPYQDKYFFADYSEPTDYGFKHSDTITVYKIKINNYDKFLTDNDLLKALQLTLYVRSTKVDKEIETINVIDSVVEKIEEELDNLK